MRANLRIRRFDDSSGLSYSVWPAADVPQGFISEDTTYAIEAFGEVSASASLSIDGLELEALRPKGEAVALWRWPVGFYAGRVRFDLRDRGRLNVSFSLVADPRVDKLTRDAFEQMAFDILEDTEALFSLSSFRLSLGQGEDRVPPPIARLELIRSRVERLVHAVEAIDRHPVRSLAAVSERKHISRVVRLEALDYQRSLQTGLVGLTTDGRVLPQSVDVRGRVVTTDTPENRFVKSYLRQLGSWLLGTADLLVSVRSGKADTDRLAARWSRICRSLSARVRSLEDLPSFRDASSRSTLTGPSSPVFARVPAYAEFRRLYVELRKCFAAVTGSFLDVPIARTFDLYELWAFLRLARAAKVRFKLSDAQCRAVLQDSAANSRVAYLKREVLLKAAGATLCFQRTYNEFWLDANGIGSFSRTMIPDIVVEGASTGVARAVVFDAKYRVGADLNEAVSSLHMYRDAVVQVQPEPRRLIAGAYILTPHLPSSVLPSKSWKELRAPAVLFHPEYRGEFKFGAISMKPGVTVEECDKILELALTDAGLVGEVTGSRVLSEGEGA